MLIHWSQLPSATNLLNCSEIVPLLWHLPISPLRSATYRHGPAERYRAWWLVPEKAQTLIALLEWKRVPGTACRDPNNSWPKYLHSGRWLFMVSSWISGLACVSYPLDHGCYSGCVRHPFPANLEDLRHLLTPGSFTVL